MNNEHDKRDEYEKDDEECGGDHDGKLDGYGPGEDHGSADGAGY
jgi:hypothetical protein